MSWPVVLSPPKVKATVGINPANKEGRPVAVVQDFESTIRLLYLQEATFSADDTTAMREPPQVLVATTPCGTSRIARRGIRNHLARYAGNRKPIGAQPTTALLARLTEQSRRNLATILDEATPATIPPEIAATRKTTAAVWSTTRLLIRENTGGNPRIPRIPPEREPSQPRLLRFDSEGRRAR